MAHKNLELMAYIAEFLLFVGGLNLSAEAKIGYECILSDFLIQISESKES